MNLRVGHLLALGFVVVIAVFATAAAATMHVLARLDQLETRLQSLDRARHDGLLTQSAIQEQYIHQAHSLIEGDRTHVDHYGVMAAHAMTQIGRLDRACEHIGFTAATLELDAAVTELDRVFMLHVVPLLGTSPSPDKLRYYHARLEHLTTDAGNAIAALNARIEGEAEAASVEFSQLLERARVLTLTAMALAVLAAIAVGIALVRSIGRPIDRLHSGLRHAASGELDARIEAHGPRELRDLAVGFNEMAAALTESRAALAHKERLAAMGEVAAGIAHEINNPLGVIKGYLGLLRDSSAWTASAGELAIITGEVDRCAQIVRNLLEFARPRALAIEPGDVGLVLREAAQRAESQFGRPIELAIESELPCAAFDERALRQILDNLIRNAHEAATGEGRVRVGAHADHASGSLVIEIEDSGPGIAEEVAKRLFQPFVTTKAQGTGLGLAIAGALARELGATLRADRSALGGARFALRLAVRSATGVRT